MRNTDDTADKHASSKATFIGKDHPRDGQDWESQCARCGSSLDWIMCDACGGEGSTEPGQLYDEDPLWYDPDDTEPCHQCGGEASFPSCLSSPEWCQAHPLEGREKIKSSTPEWFVISRGLSTAANQSATVSGENQSPNEFVL